MRRRRFEDQTLSASRTGEPDVPALVVKFAFHALAFAGYTDVQFILEDGVFVRGS